MKNIIFLAAFFYILTLFQTSFLIHIFRNNFLIFLPTIIFLVFFVFLKKGEKESDIVYAFLAGFFLDVFSGSFLGINFFGFWTLSMLALIKFFRFAFKRYVRIPGF